MEHHRIVVRRQIVDHRRIVGRRRIAVHHQIVQMMNGRRMSMIVQKQMIAELMRKIAELARMIAEVRCMIVEVRYRIAEVRYMIVVVRWMNVDVGDVDVVLVHRMLEQVGTKGLVGMMELIGMMGPAQMMARVQMMGQVLSCKTKWETENAHELTETTNFNRNFFFNFIIFSSLEIVMIMKSIQQIKCTAMPHINTTGISKNQFSVRFMLFVFQNCAFLFCIIFSFWLDLII